MFQFARRCFAALGRRPGRSRIREVGVEPSGRVNAVEGRVPSLGLDANQIGADIRVGQWRREWILRAIAVTVLVVAGPSSAEIAVGVVVGIEVSIPGGEGEASAEQPPNTHLCVQGEEGSAVGYEFVNNMFVYYCPNSTGGGGGAAGGTGGGAYSQRDGDGDGVLNGVDLCPQTGNAEAVDGDGCSASQRDDDGDGVLGGVELFVGADPSDPDTDGDGDSDGVELLDANGAVVAPDADSDGAFDVLESSLDADGDGVSAETGDDDEADPCVPDDLSVACDVDGDGVPDGRDEDTATAGGAVVDAAGVAVTTTTVASELGSVSVGSGVSASASSDERSGGVSVWAVVAGVSLAAIVVAGVVRFLRRRRREPASAAV